MMIASVFCVSCLQEEAEPQEQYGYLTIGVAEEVSADVTVKSGAEDDEIVYRLDVVDSKGNLDFTAEDHRTVTGPIELLMDKYTVTAVNGQPESGFKIKTR